MYSALHGGHPGRIHILRGHANNITSTCWSDDDRTLWTVSEDGAVYQWDIGQVASVGRVLARTKDCVRLGMKYSCITNAAGTNGAVVGAGYLKKERHRSAGPPKLMASASAMITMPMNRPGGGKETLGGSGRDAASPGRKRSLKEGGRKSVQGETDVKKIIHQKVGLG